MTVLSIILGIIMILGGMSCMFTPLATFLDAGYFIVILVVVYGIFGIIKGISEKRFGVGFVFSIISLVFGICILCFPKLMLLTDGILIYLVAAWFVLQGAVAVATSISFTRKFSGLWVLQLIFGIISILLGCYSFFHPQVLAVSLGFLLGFYFIETGFTLIFAAALRPRR